MQNEPLSRADSDLMVELCQYYAQLLYARRNKMGFDRRFETLPP